MMADKRPFTPKGKPSKRTADSKITAADIERANQRFRQQAGDKFPLLIGLIGATETET
jgi:hypothetical protein